MEAQLASEMLPFFKHKAQREQAEMKTKLFLSRPGRRMEGVELHRYSFFNFCTRRSLSLPVRFIAGTQAPGIR